MSSVLNPCRCEKPQWRYAGRASMPMETCEQPTRLVCVGCGGELLKRCRTSRGSRCAPCGVSYRRAVHHIARSGTLLPGHCYFFTLTAPGERVHRLPNGDECPCTSESTALDSAAAKAVWNADCMANWNRLHQHIERRLGVNLSCFRVVEVQRRGVLHLHVLFRVSEPVTIKLAELRSLAIRHGFGHAADLQEVSSEHAAWYVAKYAAKAADARDDAPFLNKRTGEMGGGRWRVWTSTRGRRAWGETMASVRAAQAQWARESVGCDDAGGAPGRPSGAAGWGGGDGVAGALDPKSSHYASGASLPPVGSVPAAM